jgi:hypothetical protein
MARHRSRRKNKKKGTRRRNRRQKHYGGNAEEKCLFLAFPPNSGLGNLMFAYAAAIVVKQKSGSKLCMLPYTNKHSTNDYRTLLFTQGKPVEESEVNSRLDGAKRLLQEMTLESTESHKDWEYTPAVEDSARDTILGPSYFQNYPGIESAIPVIRKDCAEIFAKKYPGVNETIPPTSAFMHVRKGDYEHLLSLNNDYYSRGLSMLDAVDAIPHIYIVSDDIEWCKKQGWTSSKIRWFDAPDDTKDELKTMYVMSLCRGGACISASTFSTWGALLGADQNEESTIIYPSSWITGRPSSEFKFPARWKQIEGIQNVFTK